MTLLNFDKIEPIENRLILHIPHSSNKIPDISGYLVNDNELENEMLLLVDWHTDDLFFCDNTIPIIADFSRVFCDVERFADDNVEPMAISGMGALYIRLDNGNRLRVVSDELKIKILNEYYYKHHKNLHSAVQHQLNNCGTALIIDCHSFSVQPFKRDLNKDLPRPDICIGINQFHTPQSLVDYSTAFFRDKGLSVKVNDPYKGTMVPMEYYQKDSQVQSIMIEINRALYLKPGTNVKSQGYDTIKSIIHEFLSKVNIVTQQIS